MLFWNNEGMSWVFNGQGNVGEEHKAALCRMRTKIWFCLNSFMSLEVIETKAGDD